MKLYTFRRGVHPHVEKGGKGAAGPLPVVDAAPPATVAIALSQHTGAPCRPLVKAGDRVKMGQMIGEAPGYVCTPIHASVSGVVKGIQQRTGAAGAHIDCIIIENDKLDTPDETLRRFHDPFNVPKDELVAAVNAAGIVGLGGAAFPTHVKLSPPPDKTIDYLILNGSECEPILSSDHRMMLDHPEKVIDGMLIAAHIVSAKFLKVGIEANKPGAIEAMKKVAAEQERGIEVLTLKTKYPQGGEKQLIEALTGRQVPSGKLPMEAGCVVLNVSTAAAISDAIRLGRPIVDHVITVAGLVKEPKNLRVRVGTSIGSILEECGGLEESANKVVLGGPMMGMSIASLDTPTVKATGGIIALKDEWGYESEPENCIRCGSCVRACPIGLMPLEYYALARKGMHEKSKAEYNLCDCIECASCAYVCPAKLPLVQMIRVSKAATKECPESEATRCKA